MMIRPDTRLGKSLGFTSDKFTADSYLWRDGKRIIVSLIISKEERKGHLRSLFEQIEASGYRVAVPTPLGRMVDILVKQGFVPHAERGAEVWERQ